MQWVSASMPVAAVTAGGRPRVSSGSANTARASSRGEKMIFLTCVCVVGDDRAAPDLAARCPRWWGWRPSTGCPGRWAARRASRPRSRTGRRGGVAMSAMALATSRAAPPPRPTMRVGLVRAEASTPGGHLRCHGVAADARRTAPASRPAAAEQRRAARREDGQRGQALVGDDQRAAQALLPRGARRDASSRAPGPKWMRVGKAEASTQSGTVR